MIPILALLCFAGCGSDPSQESGSEGHSSAAESAAVAGALDERLQLFARFGEFEAGAGIPSPRYLVLNQDGFRGDGDPRMRLFGPPSGEIRGPLITVHPGSRLELSVGIEGMDDLVPDEGGPAADPAQLDLGERAIQFSVSWSGESGETALGQKLVRHSGALIERVRQEWEIDLGPVAAQTGRILFRTEVSEGDPADIRALPTWWSPVVVTPAEPAELAPAQARESDSRSGVDERLVRNSPSREVEEVVLDLLSAAPHLRWRGNGDVKTRPLTAVARKQVAERRIWVGDDDDVRREPIERPLAGVEAHFETGAERWVPRGGSWPALAFARDGSITLGPTLSHAPLANSSEDVQYELRWRPGFHAWAGAGVATSGTVRLRVSSGDVTLFDSRFDAPRDPGLAGWGDEVAIALDRIPAMSREQLQALVGDHSDRVLRFSVEFDLDQFEVPDVMPSETSPVIDVPTHPWFGIARPRIVQRRVVERQRRDPTDESRRNVLFVCVETLRADALGCYGSEPSPSPRFDEWAQRGLLVDRAYSPAPWTLPSVGSYLTGLPPRLHGAVGERREILPDRCRTLAEAARAQGIATGAFVSNELIHARKGFAEGFDAFTLAYSARAPQLNQLVLDWFTELGDQRFFAYVHYFEPHAPLTAPGDFRQQFVAEEQRGLPYLQTDWKVKQALIDHGSVASVKDELAYLRGRYDGEVAFWDHWLGELLEELESRGVLQDTLIVITSDHGEEFGEHGWYGHGSQLFEESTRVPLLLLGPDVTASRFERPAPVLAAVSRIAETLGLGIAERLVRGCSPLPLQGERSWVIESATEKAIDIRPEEWSADRLEELTRPRPARAIWRDEIKSIHQLKGEAPEGRELADWIAATELLLQINLDRDPQELDPRRGVAETPGPWLRFLIDRWPAESGSLPSDQSAADTQEALKQLGYTNDGG